MVQTEWWWWWIIILIIIFIPLFLFFLIPLGSTKA